MNRKAYVRFGCVYDIMEHLCYQITFEQYCMRTNCKVLTHSTQAQFCMARSSLKRDSTKEDIPANTRRFAIDIQIMMSQQLERRALGACQERELLVRPYIGSGDIFL